MTIRSVTLGTIAAFLATIGPASAQFSGQLPPATVLGNAGATPVPARPVPVTTPILATGGALHHATSGVTAASYVNASITVDAFGHVTAAASGSGACGTLADTGILYGLTASTCAVDVPRLSWHHSVGDYGLHIKGGDSSGYSLFIASDYDVTASGLLRGGFNLLHQQGILDAVDSSSNAAPISINNNNGPVIIGADVTSFTSQPAGATAALINIPAGSGSNWVQSWASGGAYVGGIYMNASKIPRLRFYDFYNGAVERAVVDADPAGSSKVPNRFTAAGLTDNTLNCTGANAALQTNGSGDITCGTISGGGGGVTASGTMTDHGMTYATGASSINSTASPTNGQLLIGSTGANPALGTIAGGAGITVSNSAGGISIASSGGGAGVGLFQPVLSAIPTASSTGLTTDQNIGTAAKVDGLTGFTICGATNAGQLEGVTKTAPAGTYNIDVAIMPSTFSAGNAGFGPIFGWTDGTKYHIFMVGQTNGNLQILVLRYATSGSGAGAAGADATLQMVPGWPAMLRISGDATNVTFKISPAGDYTNAQTVYTTSKAAGYLGASGYTNIIFGINANNGGQCGTLMSYAER